MSSSSSSPSSSSSSSSSSSQPQAQAQPPQRSYISDIVLRKKVYKLLSTLESASKGVIACGGNIPELPRLTPDITVTGVGRIGLPLSKEQAIALAKAGKVAPFGHNMKTVVDTKVRCALEYDPSILEFGKNTEKQWRQAVQRVVNEATRQMNVKHGADVRAHLYKMLLYEPGGHFKEHQDTEKQPGMFGTLIIQLPTGDGHTGGMFTVRHGSEVCEFVNDGDTSKNEFSWVAFYADCPHKLATVTSGYRLVLTYNLVHLDNTIHPAVDNTSWSHEQFTGLMNRWVNTRDSGGKVPKKLIWPLEHNYTNTNGRFSSLKRRDRVVADFLRGVPSCDVHMVLVEKHEYGDPEYMECDESFTWTDSSNNRHQGSQLDTTNVRFHFESEFLAEDTEWAEDDGIDVLFGGADDKKPDEESYEGYMGNYGPTQQYYYRAAFLVFFPHCESVVDTLKIMDESQMHDFILTRVARNGRVWSADVLAMLEAVVVGGISSSLYSIVRQAVDGGGDNDRLAKIVISIVERVTNAAGPFVGLAQIVEKFIIRDDVVVALEKLLRKRDFAPKYVCEWHRLALLSSRVASVVLDACFKNTAALFSGNSASDSTAARAKTLACMLYHDNLSLPPHELTSFRAQFATLCCESEHAAVLSEILALPYVRSACDEGCVFAERMRRAQVAQLRTQGITAESTPPVVSWALPNAQHTDSQIQDFLRSDRQQMKLSGFSGIQDARHFAGRKRRGDGTWTISAAGHGRNAYVWLEKTNVNQERARKKYEQLHAEFLRLYKPEAAVVVLDDEGDDDGDRRCSSGSSSSSCSSTTTGQETQGYRPA